MPNVDAVMQSITELTNTIKEHAGGAGLDKTWLATEFTRLLAEQKAALLEELPARPGAFTGDAINRAVDSYTGKYARELRDIARYGEHHAGNWRLRGCDLLLARTLLDGANRIKASGRQFANADKLQSISPDLEAACKALTSTGTGTGDELVPTGMAAELWQDFFSASRVVNDLPTQPMPTDPFDDPLGLGDVTWRKGTQNTATTASDTATAKSTLTSTEEVAEVDWSYTLDEDAIIAMMPSLRARLALSGGEAMDAFALNADSTDANTGNINLDDANPPNDSYYLSDGQDGIRHLYIVDNTGQHVNAGGDALADADMTSLLNKLAKYGLDLNSARIVPAIQAYFAMVGLTNVATVDKYGPQATILTGELARYRGVPVIPSASQPLAEADGKVSTTAGNNTLGTISAYNRLMWKVGFRRGLLIEVDRSIQSRQLIMVASFRLAVGAWGTRSTATHTAGIRNILV